MVLGVDPPMQNDKFPEAYLEDNLASNYNRAGLSWYTIDPSLMNGSALQDGQVDAEVRQDHRMRQILLRDSTKRVITATVPRRACRPICRPSI